MFEPQVHMAFEDLIEILKKEFPQVYQIMDDPQLDETAKMVSLSQYLMQNPDTLKQVYQTSQDALAVLREEEEENSSTEVQPYTLESEENSILYKPETGLPKLNPLYESALAERLQFDEDIPELRTGPLPSGGKPAVSVDTKSRNPAQIGQLLTQASEEIHDKIKLMRETQKAELEAAYPEPEEVSDHGEIMSPLSQELDKLHWDEDSDLPEYRRGQVPLPVKQGLKGGLFLSKEDKQKYTWKFLSTTQGRRSAVSIIEDALQGFFSKLESRPFDRNVIAGDDRILFEKKWSVSVEDKNSMPANFSFIDIAIETFRIAISEFLENSEENYFLEVTSFDEYADRKFGWGVRLFLS